MALIDRGGHERNPPITIYDPGGGRDLCRRRRPYSPNWEPRMAELRCPVVTKPTGTLTLSLASRGVCRGTRPGMTDDDDHAAALLTIYLCGYRSPCRAPHCSSTATVIRRRRATAGFYARSSCEMRTKTWWWRVSGCVGWQSSTGAEQAWLIESSRLARGLGTRVNAIREEIQCPRPTTAAASVAPFATVSVMNRSRSTRAIAPIASAKPVRASDCR